MTRMPETAKILPFPTNEAPLDSPRSSLHTAQGEPESKTTPELLSAIMNYVAARGGGEGQFTTPMEGVNIICSFQERMPMRQMYRPSLCVVVQGAKQILIGEDTLEYRAMECLAVSMEVPASGRIAKASPTEPFIGMTVEIDIQVIRDVLQHLDTPPLPSNTPGLCAFVRKVDAGLADCMLRLVKLAGTPGAVPVLYPSLMREISYWLLTGPRGEEFCKLALPETHAERVAKAIYLLRDNFNRTLRIEQLADAAGMSASSFHQHFKSLTSMTPLQYQKQLRLLEARRLMVADAANVAEAAYQVGYESPSQFSREYTRMFGVAPKRDVTTYKALVANHTH